MKKNIKKVGLIVLILGFAVSVFANFYRPPFASDDIDLTVNICDETPQPIFIDKYLGVTKSINAKFELSEDSETTHITDIDLNMTRFSGLMDYGFKYACFKNKKFVIIMSPWGKDRKKVELPDGGIEAQINNPIEWQAHVYYDFTLPKDFYSLKPQQRIDSIFNILTEDGRICNINCIHE